MSFADTSIVTCSVGFVAVVSCLFFDWFGLGFRFLLLNCEYEVD